MVGQAVARLYMQQQVRLLYQPAQLSQRSRRPPSALAPSSLLLSSLLSSPLSSLLRSLDVKVVRQAGLGRERCRR